MKKLVAVLAGLIIAGISAMSVSAADYEVKKGDTLWDIANENNTNVEVLMNINGLSDSMIYPKQELKLEEKQIEYYDVEKGDTLLAISRDHEISVNDLKTWNNLSSDLIITGQQLAVNEADAEEQARLNASEETADIEAGATENNTQQAKAKAEPKEEKNNTQEAEVKAESKEDENNTQQAEAKPEPKEEEEEQQPSGKTLSVEATAYTAGCDGCSGITATGKNLNEDPYAKVIAVDPNVIPLGTEVYVEGYGYAVASDVGGSINGHKIDVHVPTKDEAYSWGRKTVDITILQ
ncbi:LysM peptidoglycan-binding domain-containing protein [Virgibacillus sp. NKC19-16]|uniref:3D domain-containing protein n=1 Tax=Virgibacillus salidurans TaxID=2831673 RepID=UPI001F1C2AD0|nr:3D domain-containing protein [Virgibacillus sp. NKC19-16]UJL44775.1 LysM peptidoglycan-binding domain-containing protein [Virgibacillus sp. NKC19-16]